MAHAFTPSDWLASFEKAGGAYVLTGERLFLWIFPGDLTADDLARARSLVAELTSQQRVALVERLRSAELVEG